MEPGSQPRSELEAEKISRIKVHCIQASSTTIAIKDLHIQNILVWQGTCFGDTIQIIYLK